MNRYRSLYFVLLLLFCNLGHALPEVQQISTNAPPNSSLAQPPYLRSVLPERAFAYLRIPNLWGFLSNPKGNLWDQQARTADYISTMQALRDHFDASVIQALPAYQNLWRFLFVHSRSPIEILALTSAQAPLPELLLAVDLHLEKPEQLTPLLQELTAQPALQLIAGMDAQGTALLSLGGMPLLLHFDAPAQRLYLWSGGTQTTQLQQLLDTLQANQAHPMLAIESEIDSSHQGLFFWMDPRALLQLAERMGKAQEVAVWRAFGASEASALAFGLGTANGKQRLKWLLDIPQTGFRNFLPAVQTTLQLPPAGALDTVLMLGLPGPQELLVMEQTMAGLISPEKFQSYQEGKAEFAYLLGPGTTLDDILAALGPELAYVHDAAGGYMVVRLRDPDKFKQLLASTAKNYNTLVEQRDINGRHYVHLRIPSVVSQKELSAITKMSPLLAQLSNLPTHLYWVEEDGYLLLASTPQVLMNRYLLPREGSMQAWLQNTQKLQAKHSLLLASTRIPDLPSDLYHLDLQMLLLLGDLLGQPVDLFKLPSSQALHFPAAGAYSLLFTTSAQRLSLELSYEYNPLEFLMSGNGMTTIAIGGILAAIAIPAYQDYIQEAKLAKGHAIAQQMQSKVDEFFATHQRLPSQEEAKALLLDFLSDGEPAFHYDADKAQITAKLTAEGNNRFMLKATENNQQLSWQCHAEMKTMPLPTWCVGDQD